MAQSMNRGRFVVGEYVVGKQIGAGSFSTVWHARHRVYGTQVAIKEIVLSRLNTKLQESLRSEIVILKRIYHPNIIRLHDMIEEAGKMYIVLEYCKGGDLSIFIQRRQGRIPEPLAKHFMQQLAAGLKILRENNIIHRDLKPQNLLLSTDDDNSVLKIADFGFARSLQPSGLADTLCGSPLYMAPEIMQLQKYDAKADLWSVGAILFQIVMGKTPFTGSNQMQLLQNIVKSTELHFPYNAKDLSTECVDLCRKLLCRSPVERLTFEEFFNHPFLSKGQPDELPRNNSPRIVGRFQFSHCNSARKTVETSHEDCFPFSLDDDSSGPDGSPSLSRRSSMQSTYGFSLDMKTDIREVSKNSDHVDLTSKQSGVRYKLESTGPRVGDSQSLKKNTKKSLITLDLGTRNNHSKVVNPLELIDQDYVLVSDPALDASKLNQFPPKSGSPSMVSQNLTSASSAPVPIIGAASGELSHFGSLGSHVSAPSQGSVDAGDAFEQPSTDCMTRIKSLQRCASVIKELVDEKVEAGRELEAFSIQLVILAIWKQALHICHTCAASAIEGSPTKVMRLRQSFCKRLGNPNNQECLDIATTEGSQHISSQIERAFLLALGNAEDLAKVVEPGNMEMPDAMETIYQSALALGRHGAVDEYMGDVENAAALYSKAVQLLLFLLVEAPSLILNPPFSLTTSDRYRLRTYIDALNNRQSISRSQRMALLK